MDVEKLIEEGARAILIADGVEYVKRDADWQIDIMRHREMLAKYPDYEAGRSLITDAFRRARAAMSALAPIPSEPKPTSDLLRRLASAQIEVNARGWYGLDVLLHEAETEIRRLELKGGDANANPTGSNPSTKSIPATSPGVTAGASEIEEALYDLDGFSSCGDHLMEVPLVTRMRMVCGNAATLIRKLVAERDEARKALATDARIDAIFAAILTTRDNPEDGTRDHLPRPLRNYLSEACGSAGLTGFNDGYAEAQGKFKSRATAAEAEVERLTAENAELKAWKKRRQEEDEDEADRREIW